MRLEGRRAPGKRDTNFCLGASKTGECQGVLGGPKGALRQSLGLGAWHLAAPDLGLGRERVLGRAYRTPLQTEPYTAGLALV